MTRIEYVVALSKAQLAESVSPQLYTLLIVLAKAKAEGELLTIDAAGKRMGRSYHSILDHISARPARAKSGKGNPHLFTITESSPKTVTLSPEGEALVIRIDQLVARYAADAASTQKPGNVVSISAA